MPLIPLKDYHYKNSFLESFYTEDFDKISLSRAQTKLETKFQKIDEDDKWSQTSESIDR